MNQDWFKLRYYPHIGLPVNASDKRKVCSYVMNPDKIKHHAFSPLIFSEIVSERYRRDYSQVGKAKSKTKKSRPICYASHLDASIYSYYSFILCEHYEKFLKEEGVSDCVTAYRKIPCKDNKKRNKCNIDLALDAFDFIKQTKNKDLAVITFDISGFFDNLDHKLLKKSWCKICNLGVALPDDHYSVFKNVTQYSFVKQNALFELFKNEIICKKENTIIKRKISKSNYLRNMGAIAYCEKSDIKKIKKNGLICKWNEEDNSENLIKLKGIPQGLSISAVLANMYMFDFDKEIYNYMTALGGLYRRYSDDIFIVCPTEDGSLIKNFIIDKIKNQKLEIQERKTHLYYLKRDINNNFTCEHENLKDKKKIEYLGFLFDGNRILLKPSSISSYYSKMIRSINRSAYYALATNSNTNRHKIFKRRLYKRFSRFGATRRLIYKRTKNNKKKFFKSKRYDWGNYLSYVYTATSIMNEPAIKKQLRKSGSILAKAIKKKEKYIKKVWWAKLWNMINSQTS